VRNDSGPVGSGDGGCFSDESAQLHLIVKAVMGNLLSPWGRIPDSENQRG